MTAIRFVHPTVLVLVILLPVAYALTRRRLVPHGTALLRLIVLGLVILSLAQPRVPRLGPGQTIMFAVDLSDSITPDARERAIDSLRAAARAKRPDDRIGLVTFGADAVLEEVPTADPRLAFASRPSGEATDIGQAIRTALMVMPAQGHRRIVLATDGNANRGDLSAALALARSQDVAISVLPVVPTHEGEVLVEEVRAPTEVQVGERFPVRVVIEATTPAQVQLQVTEGETVTDRRSMAVQPGRTIVTLSRVARAEGLLRYVASIVATPDGTTANNRAGALVVVRGAPVIWYVAQQPGVLEHALAAQGLRVRTLTPETLPGTTAEYQGVAAVVLDDVPATQLAPAQMTALHDYVGQLGGGLVAVGGLHSFGVGGYAGTPLEEALPVSMDVRHRMVIPSMAIILIIDASGSMGSYGQEIAPLELAKETAQSVIDLMGDRDIIGVIAFDQKPRWLVPPTEARNRERVFDQISRLQAGGGTDVYPAIALAYDYLRQSPAKVRHAIVLSDFMTDPGDFQGLLTRMARERMTISAVGIGNETDLELMRNVAAWGQGRSYVAKDLYTIPQIFTAEALLASRVYIVEQRFAPQVVRDDLFPEVGQVPSLRGYIATAPKPASVSYLISPQEDPLLAAWQFGLGRAVAFTSDAGPRWAADWMVWPQFARFWSQLVRSVVRTDAGGVQLSVEQELGGAGMILDAYSPSGDPVEDLDVQGFVAGSRTAQRTVALVQSVPGRYEGRVSLTEPGEYGVTVAVRQAGRMLGVRTAAVVIPYSPELRELGVNRATLSRIVEATGGHVLSDPKAAVLPTGRAASETGDAWPMLATAALVVFVAEIALRRVPVLGAHLAVLLGAVLSWLRHPPSSRQQEEDVSYAEADRWKLSEPGSAAASESMEAAARLYIARLKAIGRDRVDEPPREPRDAREPDDHRGS